MSGTLSYNDTAFRALLPYFANATTYPESQLQMFFNMATDFITTIPSWAFTGTQQQDALYYLTAHLQQIFTLYSANNGASPNIETEAQIDKVRVQVMPPIAKTAFQQWLNQTPFGQMLRALLSSAAAGGFYMAGRSELLPFRRAGGGFG